MSRALLVVAALAVLASCTTKAHQAELDSTPIYKRNFPVDRDELFRRVDKLTLMQCTGARSKEIEQNCISQSQSRIASCKSTVAIPESLPDIEAFKAHAKSYLLCSQPVTICRGVQISNDQDATQHCI